MLTTLIEREHDVNAVSGLENLYVMWLAAFDSQTVIKCSTFKCANKREQQHYEASML